MLQPWFLITRMACYAAKMLNEISQGEDYLWDFLILLRSLLKYQSTVISSKILWRLPQHPLSTFPHPQFCLRYAFPPHSQKLPSGSNHSQTVQTHIYNCLLSPIGWEMKTQSWHGPRILAFPSKTCISRTSVSVCGPWSFLHLQQQHPSLCQHHALSSHL